MIPAHLQPYWVLFVYFSLANGARSHSKHWICTRKEENRPYIHARKITLNWSFEKVTRAVYLSIEHDINGRTWNLTALCSVKPTSAKPTYRTNKRCCVERGRSALRSFEGKKGFSLAMRENKRGHGAPLSIPLGKTYSFIHKEKASPNMGSRSLGKHDENRRKKRSYQTCPKATLLVACECTFLPKSAYNSMIYQPVPWWTILFSKVQERYLQF